MSIAIVDANTKSNSWDFGDNIETLIGGTIIRIVLRKDEDSSQYRDDYMNYELLVETDKGVLRFAGCHDAGGNVEYLLRQGRHYD